MSATLSGISPNSDITRFFRSRGSSALRARYSSSVIREWWAIRLCPYRSKAAAFSRGGKRSTAPPLDPNRHDIANPSVRRRTHNWLVLVARRCLFSSAARPACHQQSREVFDSGTDTVTFLETLPSTDYAAAQWIKYLAAKSAEGGTKKAADVAAKRSCSLEVDMIERAIDHVSVCVDAAP